MQRIPVAFGVGPGKGVAAGGRNGEIHRHAYPRRQPQASRRTAEWPRGCTPFDGPILERASSIRKEMESSGVEYALCMPRWNNEDNDPLGINETLELAVKVRCLYAIGIADPTKTLPRHLDRVEDILKEGEIVGIQSLSGLLPLRS